MDLAPLGRTGLRVSRLCLGTMNFGAQVDRERSFAILDTAADSGINFIDTADVYPSDGSHTNGLGMTEEIVGEWLKPRRDEFILATNAGYPTGAAPWHSGNSRKHLLDAVEGSLRRLQTDYIDLYQLHKPDRSTPIDETLSALDDLVHSGKVRYIGCSNFYAYELARALGRSELRGWERFSSVQPRYNLLFREPERELFRVCAEEDLAVLPYNPLAGGFLSGKYDLVSDPEASTRFVNEATSKLYRDRYWHESMFEAVKGVHRLAAEAGMSCAQLAISWVLAQPPVTSAIVGASRPEQLAETLIAGEQRLDATLVEALDELTVGFRRGDSQH
jgi:1-deoxyxylulose-5-phosphate synthase